MRNLTDRKRTMLAAVLVALALIGGVWAGVNNLVSANNIALNTTVFATDYVAAGVGGMRDIGTGSIVVSGVSGTVTKALLYWHGPMNSTDSSANASVTFNGNAITGANIGHSSDNCWGYTESQGYRADVTSLVSGNGTYTLSNFTKLSNSINVNGVSLLVFFNDGVTANNRDIVIFDGNDSNISNPYDADNWNITLAGITYTSGTASMQLHVGDGQPYGDDAVILNASTLVPTDFDTVDGVFDGTTAQDPNAADPYLRLWDINSFNITSFLSPGPNTLTMSTGVYSDCLALVVAVIDLPAGAAPEQPTPTPTIPPTEPTATPVPQPTATPAPEPTATPVPPSNGGRMTGGGNVAIGSGKSAKKYTWGFELRCDGSAGNFEYQDHAQKLNFKLTGISGVICSDDSSISEGQPVAGFDTLYLSGTGKLNGVSGATIAVTLKDAGEPGVNDTIEISVSGTPGASTINKILTGGNHQAHPAG